MKKKLIYIVSDIDKSLHFEWVSAPLSERYELKFILIGNPASKLGAFLSDHHIPFFAVTYRTRTDGLLAWLRIYRILSAERPSIVHTHLWIANILGLSIARIQGIPVRIYTRHHAMIHHSQFRSGLKWDKLCNWLATDIIAISENVRKILINLERVPAKKVHIINHGFDLDYFRNVSESRTGILKHKYHIREDFFPVVGIIARYTKWKGIEFVIESFRKVQHRQPTAHLILANATGDYAPFIKQLLSTLPEGSFTEITFEDDLAALYKVFDVFVHVPPDPTAEAFGQTYVEALASGVPSVFTLSGIASEFIVHKQNALVVNFQDADEISDAIQTICSDESVRRTLVSNGRASVSAFSIHIMSDRLIDLYG